MLPFTQAKIVRVAKTRSLGSFASFHSKVNRAAYRENPKVETCPKTLHIFKKTRRKKSNRKSVKRRSRNFEWLETNSTCAEERFLGNF